MSIKQLADKLEREGLERKVTFNVLTQDKLISPGWFYFREKDSIQSRYYAVVSSPENPKIYFKQKVGEYIWGIRIPWNPENNPEVNKIKDNIKRIKKEIEGTNLKIFQEYIPEFLREK